MSPDVHTAKVSQGGTLLEPRPEVENPTRTFALSLWRCRNCGAIYLAAPDYKPEPCDACGAMILELLDD